MSKLSKTTLSLKQFMLRQEVLKLYRDIFRTLRLVTDDTTRNELKEWARADFRNNMHHTDETTIKARLYYGKKSLKDLQHSLALSRS
ncbi:LYR motif-containing protein 2 [Galleria mellonella]|uniref:LYR motif-containing protein 2 n=1 Tax=Galleria mellonella TaxID=7137 RepID=A0A6J1W7K2_GALME|nr:LYR motif-containing protein 2 [Galleria mellonella]